MGKEIRIHIAGMIYNQSLTGTYSLVLKEEGGLNRRFSIMIGEAEAQSIALKLNNAKLPRPLSHDLMNSIIRELNAKLIKVVIHEMVNDIFHAEIYLMQGETPVVIDARTSDAIALAIRSDAPIFINSEILETVGIVINEEELRAHKQESAEQNLTLEDLTGEKLRYISLGTLQELLDQAVEEERYEIAAKIRDEIDLRE
ncbi:MAG: bifunctional nuclease family protein [Bacteroidales bacterium]|nr:bifunctional nuclease family protein [Bacteroidales bacterium]